MYQLYHYETQMENSGHYINVDVILDRRTDT